MDNHSESEKRQQQMRDELLKVDFHLMRGNWGKANYHLDTVKNVLYSIMLAEELDAMRKEKDDAEANVHHLYQ